MKQKLWAVDVIDRRNLCDEQFPELKEKRIGWIKQIKMMFGDKVKLGELYKLEDKNFKSKFEFRQSDKDIQYCNTRLKLPSETCFEIDNLEWKKALKIMSEVVSALDRNDIHYAMFCANGQRSPHIRIYDFEELEELEPQQREEAQKQFWKSLCPFLYKYADKSIWMDDHPLQLEFAPHWKYGTDFVLIEEHIPAMKPVVQEVLFEVKKGGYFENCLSSEDFPRVIYEKKKKAGYKDNIVNVKWDFMKLLHKRYIIKLKADLEKYPNFSYTINRQPNEDEILVEEIISTMPVYLGKRLEVYHANA